MKHYPGAQGVIKPAAARPSTNEWRFFVPQRPISRSLGWFEPVNLEGDALLFVARTAPVAPHLDWDWLVAIHLTRGFAAVIVNGAARK